VRVIESTYTDGQIFVRNTLERTDLTETLTNIRNSIHEHAGR